MTGAIPNINCTGHLKPRWMIDILQLSKSFGKQKVLREIDLTFGKGEIIAVLGPNGSGKTTLLKCILGMVNPSNGKVIFNGKSIRKDWLYRDEISYLPQLAHFPPNLTLKNLFVFIKKLRKRETRDVDLMQKFELKQYWNTPLRHLSGGTRQKVNVVLAFMFDNPVIILDEPTTGLDPIGLIHLKEMIRQEKNRGKLIIVTTHILGFVDEMADRIIFLLEGKVEFNGGVKAIKKEFDADGLDEAIAQLIWRNQKSDIRVPSNSRISGLDSGGI